MWLGGGLFGWGGRMTRGIPPLALRASGAGAAVKNCALQFFIEPADSHHAAVCPLARTIHIGWGGRIRTCASRDQNPLPYRLATPQKSFCRIVPGRSHPAGGRIIPAILALTLRASAAYTALLEIASLQFLMLGTFLSLALRASGAGPRCQQARPCACLSNLRITGSKPVALPLGYAPIENQLTLSFPPLAGETEWGRNAPISPIVSTVMAPNLRITGSIVY